MTVTLSKATNADPDADALGFAAAREVCRRHARSFYFASFFLAPAKRDAAYAVYAFCRMIDDAIDADDDAIESASGLREHPAIVSGRTCPAAAQRVPAPGVPSQVSECTQSSCDCSAGGGSLDTRLNLFRDRLDEIYAGTLELPSPVARSGAQNALHAFAVTVRRYGIPKQHFLDLAEGCRMDLTVRRYATWASLERYCYHVAGVVGLVMCGVFGVTNSGAAEQAVRMGNAMQLTNILRDVKEDWERGRIYLPLEDLARFRYGERDLAAGVVNDAFRALMRFEIARARQLYREAAEGLCWIADDRARLTAAAMATIYSGILGAIERQGYDVFSNRARLGRGRKLMRLPAAWRLARTRPGEKPPDVFR